MNLDQIIAKVLDYGLPGVGSALILYILYTFWNEIQKRGDKILSLHEDFQKRIDAVTELRLNDLKALQTLAHDRLRADISSATALDGVKASVDRMTGLIDRFLLASGKGG